MDRAGQRDGLPAGGPDRFGQRLGLGLVRAVHGRGGALPGQLQRRAGADAAGPTRDQRDPSPAST